MVQLLAGNTIINPAGTFVYSSTPAAGNLISSDAPVAGTDRFGNIYLQGNSAYGATFASSLQGGILTLYTGSLAGGWTARGNIQCDALGDILILANRQVAANNNTLDDGAGNMTVVGTLSVNGSTNTGSAGLPDGTIHGTSGPASAGTAHTHSPGSFAVGNGVHVHVL